MPRTFLGGVRQTPLGRSAPIRAPVGEPRPLNLSRTLALSY